MNFEITILGSSSATPTSDRHPTSQFLNINEHFFLLDCGEGTQMQLLRYKLKASKINHIFISHLHGDHYFGLIGLLSSQHLQGRVNPLHVYGPAELEEILNIQFKYSQTELKFPLIFHTHSFEVSEQILETDDITVSTIVLSHRIPCTGYLFREKQKKRKIIKEKLQVDEIPLEGIVSLKNGIDYTDARGQVYKVSEYTTPPAAPRSYAYCSDTIFNESIIPLVQGVDMLYHESTFLEELAPRASETFHSTAAQAATIAKKAGVKQLLIGHFSSRYKDLKPFLKEAKAVFPQTSLAEEGRMFTIG